MSRVAVRAVAVAIVGFSLWTMRFAWTHARGRRGESLVTTAVVLALLGLVAAEALWSMRGHAFLAYSTWAVAAIVAIVMMRMLGPGGAHAVRIVPATVYAGLVLGGAAIFLRRAT